MFQVLGILEFNLSPSNFEISRSHGLTVCGPWIERELQKIFCSKQIEEGRMFKSSFTYSCQVSQTVLKDFCFVDVQ